MLEIDAVRNSKLVVGALLDRIVDRERVSLVHDAVPVSRIIASCPEVSVDALIWIIAVGLLAIDLCTFRIARLRAARPAKVVHWHGCHGGWSPIFWSKLEKYSQSHV